MIEMAELDPRAAAERLVRAQLHDATWLDAFAEQLDRQRKAQALERILGVWGLNQSDAARLFGVSRQAISKWLNHGVPAERAEAVADLAAATDLLVRHVKRERIPAVVRRRASALGDRSLLELLDAQRYRDALEACRAMFAFTEAQS
jgi:predicted transcriptional regulator